MSENQVITPEQLEEYMQGLYAKSKVARICRGTLH